MRDLICPKCGNADPEWILAVTRPYMPHVKELRGQVLEGYRCEICGTMATDSGEPAGASMSGAH